MRTYRLLPLILAAVVATCVLLQVRAAAGSPDASTQNPQGELLLLEVRVGQLILDSDLLFAYRTPEGLLIPLGQLSHILELGLTVLPGQGRAEGVIGREGRPFQLDVARGFVTIGQDRTPLDPARVRVYPEDIYVDAMALSRWLPMDLEVDFAASVLHVKPREPLPVQLRLERESRWEKLRHGESIPETLYPHLDNSYRLLAGPFVDPSVTLSVQRDEQGRQQTHAQYTLYATADILQMNGAVSLSGREGDPVSTLHFTLGRRQPEPTLLGPLRAREFSLGDVIYPALPLVSSPKLGRGVDLSSYPLGRPDQFDRMQLRGDLPEGWAVELYQGSVLLDFQEAGQNRIYRFDDLPVRYGENEFRLVFYGPQGQTREEVRRFFVGDSLVPPGEHYYRLTVGEEEDGQARVLFQYDQGLSRHFSAGIGATGTLEDAAVNGYATLSLRGWTGRLLAQADMALAEDGGSAGKLGLHARWGSVGTSVEYTQLWSFSSENFPTGGDPVQSRVRWALDAALPTPGSSHLPVSVAFQQDRLESGDVLSALSSRISAYWNGFSLTNWLDAEALRGEVSADGTLLLTRSFGRYAARASLRYDLEPLAQVRQFSLSLNGSVAPEYAIQLQMSRFLDTNDSRYAVDLVRNTGTFAAGIGAEYTSSGGIGLRLSLSVGLGREPHYGTWRAGRPGMARAGAASALAFVDANENGRMDPGEHPLEGVAFLVNGSLHPARTDEGGVALLDGLAPYRVTTIQLATATLEDPSLRPAVQGFSVIPRPGSAVALDFPVVVAGEVNGFAYLVRGGEMRQVSGMELELVNAQGEVVKRTESAFDGFFLFEDVRPGDYEVRIAPGQVARLGLKPARVFRVHVPPDGFPVDEVHVVAEVVGAGEPSTERVSLAMEQRPRGEEEVAAERPKAPSTAQRSSPELVVYARPGDTPSQIAWDFAMSLDALIRANHQITDARRIAAGQEVRIPGFVAESYIIQRGDTLFSIARAHGIRLAGLLRMNPQISDPERIVSGQVIWVPVLRTSPYPVRPYTVQRGDTFFSIARTHGLTVEELLKINPLVVDPRRIVVGQTVWVPAAAH